MHDDDLIVATHGRSFWILDDISPLRQMTQRGRTIRSASFQAGARPIAFAATPIPTRRFRRMNPPDENPPDGAIIDYFLAQPSSAPVTLEILDAQGKLVRRYSSTDRPERRGRVGERVDSACTGCKPFAISSASAGHASLGLGLALSDTDFYRA